ncbi:MAG: efflux RND transporter permease subunit [bacterium]
MKLSRFAIHRPVFTTMVALIVVILGGVSLSRLPIDLMPDITYPTLTVRTEYENASPYEIEEMVTRPIEEAVSVVPGVEEVTSMSMEGVSNVRVTFAWGTDLDAAANDIRDRLDRVMRVLPEDADRPTLFKFDLASFPVLILGASSRLDPVQMREIIDDQIKYRIERVPGVAALDVWGGLEREIHVDLDPDKINALGLPLDLILDRVRQGNVTLPGGQIDQGNYEVTVRTPGEYTSLDELRHTVVAMRDGVPVRVRDVATVEDSWERVRRIVRVNGEPGVRLAVRKQSGTNTVQVATRALAEVARINRDIPQIRLIPIIDTSDYIQRSIANVSTSALCGGGLAILVLLFFLRNLRSTAVIATAIPISIVASFAVMYFSGFTLNLMTLGGLALGVGMLVDGSIVVLENIYRLRESGEGPEEAAAHGSEEVAAPIIASTLTTLVVFLPLVFVRGMAGVMFKQFAFVVAFALLCALGVALTLVPMLGAKVLGTPGGAEGSLGRRLYEATGRLFTGLEGAYRRLLHWALDHRAVTVLAALAILGGSVSLVPLVGQELMPASDESEVRVYAEMEVGIRLALSDEKLKQIAESVREAVPEMKNMVARIGASHWRGGGSHTGNLRIALVPRAQRSRSSQEIADDLRKRLANIPGVTVRTRAGQGLFIMRMATGGGEDKVQVEIRGHDLETSDVLARRVKTLVEQVDGITDAKVSRDFGSPEQTVVIDRQKAADLGLTVSRIAEALETALSGTRASDYREGGNEYRILVKLKNAERLSLRELLDLTLTNADGELVVLRNVVRVEPRTGPVTIERKDQERIVSVAGDISGRDMGSVIADTRERLRAIPVPRDFAITFGGEYEEQQEAFAELLVSLLLALVLVYMVMACQFESLRDPFVVMFSVPLAATGVILMLFLTDTTLNIQSYIGCIMLGGIVVNNAILLVDHTNLLCRRDGLPLRQAIEEAGRRRMRPILMTASTTCLGLTPLALGLGEGGEAQAPMARAVIGGLLSSTLITLVVIPTVYSIFEGWLPRGKAHAATRPAGPHEAQPERPLP